MAKRNGKRKRKGKRKLTAAEKAEKKKRRQEFMTIFIRGKMKRVRRPPTIEGMDPEEFIRQNADPIWLHQNELWEYMEPEHPEWVNLLNVPEKSELPTSPEPFEVLDEPEDLEEWQQADSAEQPPPIIDFDECDRDIPF